METIYHLFVVNPISFRHHGKLEQVINEIRSIFSDPAIYGVHISQFPWDATGFIRSFAKTIPANTALRVYAVGGDGILFDCLNGIIGLQNAELAAVPYGHINNFVQGFGKKPLFLDLKRQISAPSIPIDVIRCGGKYGLNCCIVGTEARAIAIFEKMREFFRMDRSVRQWFYNRLSKTLFFLCNFIAYVQIEFPLPNMGACIDGEELDGNYRSINVFNSSYYGGLFHPVNASVDDGMFDVVAARRSGRLRTIMSLSRYLNGRLDKLPALYCRKRGQRAVIKSEATQTVFLDEIIFYCRQVSLELLPGAVKFVDPRRDPGGSYEK